MAFDSAHAPEAAISPMAPLRDLVRDYGVTERSDSLALCYGSVALDGGYTMPEHSSALSDLDMLIVTEGETLGPDCRQQFIDDLVALHHRTGRLLDTEVPYDNKLFYTMHDICDACSLGMFETGPRGGIVIPELVGMEEGHPYFASRNMKLRLGLNAFTSAHVLLDGNAEMYQTCRAGSLQALRRLATGLAVEQGVANCPAASALPLLLGHGEASYKDYLGYSARDTMFVDSVGEAFAAHP